MNDLYVWMKDPLSTDVMNDWINIIFCFNNDKETVRSNLARTV